MNDLRSATHYGSQFQLKHFDIEEMKARILSLGYTYEDMVRGKKAKVHEISYSECFPSLDKQALEFVVGKEAVDCAELLYKAAMDTSKSTSVVNDIYIVEDYVDLVQKAEGYKEQSTGSNRQTLIYFKHSHCFQSMQFMKSNDCAKVVVNMRSCNLIENFLIDLALAWVVTNRVFNGAFKEIDVVMNIASLHVLEKDR